MAIAISCLEQVLVGLEISSHHKQSLLNIFWQFVETDDRIKWDQDCRDHTLLMDVCDYAGGWRSTKPDYPGFDLIEIWVYRLIFEMYELGGAELYGAVGGHSEKSYENLLAVLTLFCQNGYDVPSLEPYLRSPFSQKDKWGEVGWGTAVPRDFFNNDGG